MDATPVIGYREEGGEDEDKKGVYFIKGDLEIATVPFLSLEGALFIKLDSPWLSPAPDKTWWWELGGKEWQLGGSFGIKASVEHILGSKEFPSLEFQEVDFSAEKFMTDLLEEKAAPSAQQAAEKAGGWRERNERTGEAPPVAGGAKHGTGISEGMPPTPAAPTPAVKPSVAPSGPSEEAKKKAVLEQNMTGKTPIQNEENLKKIQQKKREVEKEIEKTGPQKMKPKTEDQRETEKLDTAASREKEHQLKWERGAGVVNQALKYKKETGISAKELDSILKSIVRKRKDLFKDLYQRELGNEFIVYGEMSDGEEITRMPTILAGPSPDWEIFRETPAKVAGGWRTQIIKVAVRMGSGEIYSFKIEVGIPISTVLRGDISADKASAILGSALQAAIEDTRATEGSGETKGGLEIIFRKKLYARLREEDPPLGARVQKAS